MNTYSIRPATSDDITAILAIEKTAYPLPWTAQQFLDEIDTAGRYFLVFTDDETDTKVAGYVVFHDLGHETHIISVTVSLEWRGLGMGRRLLTYAVNHAYKAEHDRVFLDVRVDNEGAIALYKKAGFIERGKRPGFYSDGKDALLLELTLGDDCPDPASSMLH